MKIGDLKLENNVFLAPMAGITDMPFRMLCKEQGCGLVYSEMVSAKGLYYKDKKTYELLRIEDKEKPIAVQIFGSDPTIMAEIAPQIEELGACAIDINMGCPTPKIIKNGDGCALMNNPDVAAKVIEAVANSVNIPVTVKIRKGWDDENTNATLFAIIAEASGAKAITVHGRTREQFYSGKADWDIIKDVKRAVKIPVIGNGDIFSPQDAKAMLEYTGCDAIMIGRYSRGNPWIFSLVINYLKTGKLLKEVKPEERIEMAIRHLRLLVDYKGEYIAVKEARKHIAWYVKGLTNSAKIRQVVNVLSTQKDMEGFLYQYLDGTL